MTQNHRDLEEKIRKSEENIQLLTNGLKESSRSKDEEIKILKKEIEENKKWIARLEKELKESRDNEESLRVDIKNLKKKNQELEEKYKGLQKDKNQEESVFIVMQIGTKTQRNMCKHVLGDHFNEDSFYKYKDINKYIEEDLMEYPDDQEAARLRLNKLKEKMPWNQRLVDSLKTLNYTRIGIAHPELSGEKIKQATDYLKEEKILTEGMIDNIKKLKEQWEKSEELLK